MRILYLTDGRPDYLADDLLYGLRSVLKEDLVDYPRKDVLYANSPLRHASGRLYGRGFHCFGLDDVAVDRDDIGAKIRSGYFDAIVNSSGWRIACPLHPQLVVFDGEDHLELTPRYFRRVPLYFKRELPRPDPGLEPILFALPDFLYDPEPQPRTQKVHASFLPTSDVRRELATRFTVRTEFETWRDYQADIKCSWFALSPLGAGYDCQRHYEILGQAVLCLFLDDDAPYLMRRSFLDGHNCLTFGSVAELSAKLDTCRDPEALIERGADALRSEHLASRRAQQVLDRIAAAALPRRRLRLHEQIMWATWLQWRIGRHGSFGVAH